MQDARLKVGATLMLSCAAFISIWGACAALLWWLIFTPRFKSLPRPRAFAGIFAMISIIAVITWISGGDGISYLFRMSAILIIAGWAFSERKIGELMDVSVWLFGNRRGFDIGMLAEMSLGTLELVENDISNMRMAQKLKGKSWDLRAAIPLSAGIITSQIQRAEEQAKILAVRGYMHGGTYCPTFQSSVKEKLAFTAALLIVPVSAITFVMFLYL